MNQKAILESVLQGNLDADAADDAAVVDDDPHVEQPVVVGPQVGEQLVGGHRVVVVAGDLAVDEVADPHHLAEVGGVVGVDGLGG